jgi:branched-chain amino acid transport system substrate-binding protein
MLHLARRKAGPSTREAELRCKRIFAFAPVPLLLIATACTPSESTSADKTDIVIAASLELTGSNADVGHAYENAVRLKVDQINASGAAHQRRLVLRVRDNRGDAELATNQIAEFGADPSVTSIITGWCSECVMNAASVVNERAVPTFALAPASKVSTPIAERKFLFKIAPNVDHDAAALYGELSQLNPPITSLGLLASSDAYGVDARDAMLHQMEQSKIKIAPVAQFKPTDNDLGPPARVIMLAKPIPEAVVVLAFPNQAAMAINALRVAGYKGRIFLDASAAGPLFLPSTVATAAENTHLVFTPTLAIDDLIATTPANAARKQWFRDYTARYGSYYAQASFAADAVQLISDAVVRAGSATNRAAIRDAAEAVQFDGLSGPIRMAPDNHSGLMPQSLTMLVARGGRWRLVA